MGLGGGGRSSGAGCVRRCLGCSFSSIDTGCVNVQVLHTVLPVIRIKMLLSISVNKTLYTIWYSCPCIETPEAMSNESAKILLLNLSMGQHC